MRACTNGLLSAHAFYLDTSPSGSAGAATASGGGAAAKKLDADTRADVGGAGDVPHGQQGHQAGEGAHPGIHGRVEG